ncbi:MAG: cytochrome c [Pseudomonadales bacterium]
MFNVKKVVVVSLFVAFSSYVSAGDKVRTSGGVNLDKNEIDKWSITVYQDGRNLPDGNGDAIKGEVLYQAQCIACHGVDGDRGPAPRLAGPLGYPEWSQHPLHALTVGAWPYTTAIFDYIRRAMPHHSPKTLSDSDTYALTAYILHLNDLIENDYVLDRETLMKVEMPYRKKSFSAWEESEGGEIRGKPLQ